jgi:hypothetical protein
MRTSFHHQPKAQHSLAIHKLAGRLPHLFVPFDRSPRCDIMAAIEGTTDMSRTSPNRRE